MPPDQRCQIEAFESHRVSRLFLTPIVIRSFEYNTGDCTIWLYSTPILRESTSLPLLPTSRSDLRVENETRSPSRESEALGPGPVEPISYDVPL
ncbi:hypothetical protein TNCV_3370511 [Trichonephila clavipes]|nr:hypothetical protein TNCV_3370511 [Trichonephila clavipes]